MKAVGVSGWDVSGRGGGVGGRDSGNQGNEILFRFLLKIYGEPDRCIYLPTYLPR